MRLWPSLALLLALNLSPLALGSSGRLRAEHVVTLAKSAHRDPWAGLPFTAREWARQTVLPFRQIPLKGGGTMSVQRAYDLYLKAGQPEYPDRDTPGLVTEKEIETQVRISEELKRKPH